jgi:prepilin peptidase CpaA
MKEFVLVILLCIASMTDVKSLRIPNWLTLSTAVIGLGLQALLDGLPGLGAAGIGLIVGIGVMLSLHVVGAVGAGDVKLFGAIGALSSATFVLSALSYSIVFAACIGLLIMISRRQLAATMKQTAMSVALLVTLKDTSVIERWKRGATLQFPFMLAVVPGCLAAYVQGV